MEIEGVLVGAILCILGIAIFVYGITNISPVRAVSDSFLAVVGIFLGIAGLIVLMTNAFASGPFFK